MARFVAGLVPLGVGARNERMYDERDKEHRMEPSWRREELESRAWSLLQLPDSAAEQFLATLWCVLEEYDLASPTITVELKNGLIDMRFAFASPEDCAAAMVALEEMGLILLSRMKDATARRMASARNCASEWPGKRQSSMMPLKP
jgi:hypothetical protein